MRSILFFGIFALSTVTIAGAAETKRDLGAHEHGVGKLNIAVENDQIALELRAPGADIVGFEHHAESAKDRQKVDAAVVLLARPLDLFRLPDEANCQVREANVELHGRNDHAEDPTDEDKHPLVHEGEEDDHTEFHAAYVLTCANPDVVTQVDFAYFSYFPNADALEVQMISHNGSTAFKVNRDNPRLDLSGMI
ncbi:MAG: DUF2796 domain-containing protein [Hyphomicrobiaceae bacterium]